MSTLTEYRDLVGDPRSLGVVCIRIERRAKLLGLDAKARGSPVAEPVARPAIDPADVEAARSILFDLLAHPGGGAVPGSVGLSGGERPRSS
jgi:hypothetical protein